MEVTLNMVVWNIINLGIILWLIWHFGKKPVKEMIDKKQASIIEEIDNLHSTVNELKQKLSLSEDKIKNIDNEIRNIEQSYKSLANTFITNIEESTKQETQKIKDQAMNLLQQELNQIKSELRREILYKSINASKNIIKDSLNDKELHLNLIKNSLAKLNIKN